jgi:8-oxo-dGTP pyrophosphatase MutT (NUDIX family)
MEIVDMVNHHGRILGSLPRPFVHSWNILHRGIGMIVTKDKTILNPAQGGRRPEIYVHQRAATKRIFPSLYDMFVGGVSSRGESAEITAAREIAEELGLTGALEFQRSTDSKHFNPLSEELFQCTVCTPYNRCVVSMFTYRCLTEKETIGWQDEEVQWGDFVPYEIVEVAARLSIDRLVERGLWPGGTVEDGGDVGITRDQMEAKIGKLKHEYSNHLAWESWDFVPDGLLVWQAWLYWFNRKTS